MKHKFEKVFDKRNQRVRGLWKRNGVYYAQLCLDDTGVAVRVPLHGAETVPQAVQEMQVLKAKRDKGELSVRMEVNAPTLTVAEAVTQYVSYLETMGDKTIKSRKREAVSLKNWTAFCGGTPLADVKRPLFFNYAEWRRKQKKTRGGEPVSGRCIDLEVSNMMNVLRKFHDDGTLKGELFDLKWPKLGKTAAPKRLLDRTGD